MTSTRTWIAGPNYKCPTKIPEAWCKVRSNSHTPGRKAGKSPRQYQRENGKVKASRFAPEVPNSVAAAAAFESLRTFALLESIRAYEAPYGAEFDHIHTLDELEAARCAAIDAAHDEALDDMLHAWEFDDFDAECAIHDLRAARTDGVRIARNAPSACCARMALDRIIDAVAQTRSVGASVPPNLERSVLRA